MPWHAITLELDAPLKFTHFTVENPDRLVVDLEGVEFNGVLNSLRSSKEQGQSNFTNPGLILAGVAIVAALGGVQVRQVVEAVEQAGLRVDTVPIGQGDDVVDQRHFAGGQQADARQARHAIELGAEVLDHDFLVADDFVDVQGQ